MPAYTQDFKLEQDQLRDITNNLEQLNESQTSKKSIPSSAAREC